MAKPMKLSSAEEAVRSSADRPKKEVRMSQILAAQWQGDSGLSYSIFALGVDGAVYRYDPKCEGWIRWPMVEAGCRMDHKGRR